MKQDIPSNTTASVRLDAPELQVGLVRLDAFKAVTTLSVRGRQSAPFTLEIPRPRPRKDGEEIAALLEEELEVRVGQELGRCLTDEELNEFNAINDIQHSTDWLNSHCPDYRSMVYSIWRQMEDELLRFRHRIAGASAVPPLSSCCSVRQVSSGT